MNTITRRSFLKNSGLVVGGATLVAPYLVRGQNLNSKISVACIGVGGKGDSDSSSARGHGATIVAICDTNENELNRKARQKGFEEAKPYRDFRKLLDEMGNSIDAVTVSTADHTHGAAGIRAMKMGKHIYCQKPLTQTVWEAREMRRLAKEKNLATQMGNQGSAESGLRRSVEVIQSGVIGKPKELHVWSNRPIWPQGIDVPEEGQPVPGNLDWDLWLGPAPARSYRNGICPFNWRGYLEYGTGALGDMACHTVNMPFRALKLGYPTVVEAEITSRLYPVTYPKTSRIRFEFPEREGLPPLKFWWYDGNPGDALKPLRPPADAIKEILAMRGELPGSGCLVVGEKGKIFSPDDYGARFFILTGDSEKFEAASRRTKKDGKDVDEEHDAIKDVPKTIPRSPGHDREWFDAMKAGKPELAYSNFDIAAYLTEIILLGCIALRVGEGRRMEWNGPEMLSPNIPDAAKFVKRTYRPGWEV
jgi:predicted dehydrogenase